MSIGTVLSVGTTSFQWWDYQQFGPTEANRQLGQTSGQSQSHQKTPKKTKTMVDTINDLFATAEFFTLRMGRTCLLAFCTLVGR